MAETFDRYSAEYERLIAQSIGFSGREHSFFLQAKALALHGLVRRYVGDPARARTLDVGCGPGIFHRHLRAFRRLEAVDVAPEMVARARAANEHVRYHVGSGQDLPFDDGCFDVAFAMAVLHHVPPGERAPFMDELRRVTRPGGLSVVFEHNPFNPLTRLVVARCPFDEDAVLLRRGETESLLQRARLGVVEAAYILFFPWQARLLRRMERWLGPVPLGAQYYVAARR